MVLHDDIFKAVSETMLNMTKFYNIWLQKTIVLNWYVRAEIRNDDWLIKNLSTSLWFNNNRVCYCVSYLMSAEVQLKSIRAAIIQASLWTAWVTAQKCNKLEEVIQFFNYSEVALATIYSH